MAGQISLINIGTAPGAGDGEAGLYTAGAKINAAIEAHNAETWVTASSDRNIANSDHRAMVKVTANRTLTWPGTLVDGHVTTIVLDGELTLTISGTAGATFRLTSFTIDNPAGAITPVVVSREGAGDFVVFAPAPAAAPKRRRVTVGASVLRELTAADDGAAFHLAAGAVLAIPAAGVGGLPDDWECLIVPRAAGSSVERGTGNALIHPDAGDASAHTLNDGPAPLTLYALGADEYLLTGPLA